MFLDLKELFFPSVFPLIFLSGLVDELDFPYFLNLLCRSLLFLFKPFYFFDILILYSTNL